MVEEHSLRMGEATGSIPSTVQRNQKLKLISQIFYNRIEMDPILDTMSNHVIMEAMCIIHSPFCASKKYALKSSDGFKKHSLVTTLAGPQPKGLTWMNNRAPPRYQFLCSSHSIKGPAPLVAFGISHL